MEVDPKVNSRKNEKSWLGKRDVNDRDGQRKDGVLAITSGSHVAAVVETLEGKSVETTPQKNQAPKRQKSDDPLAGSPEECRRDQ
jgi:hypothetical protein